MAEQIGTADKQSAMSDPGSARAKFNEAAASTQSLSDQAMAMGKDITDKAKELAGTSNQVVKERTSDFVDAAKDVASQASEKLKGAVDDRKSSGAEYVGSLANSMRRAAREFDAELPMAGTYIRKAASQVESVSDTIRTGSFNDLLRNAQSFARRQPTAFLGIAVLAGFGVVRFLKSSAEESTDVDRSNSAKANTGNTGYRDDFSN